MVLPNGFISHGTAMGFPWDCHGWSHGLYWTSLPTVLPAGLPWDYHWDCMEVGPLESARGFRCKDTYSY